MTEKELMHFGIPGMRWGQRRAARKAENGAHLIRKVGGKYAGAMDKKAERLKGVNLKRGAKKAERGAALIRKGTEAYAGSMDKKAQRLKAKANKTYTPEEAQKRAKIGAIAGKTALKMIGTKLATNIVSNLAYKAGYDSASTVIRSIGKMTNVATGINAAIKIRKVAQGKD